jgi:hypothetical protein
MPYYGKLLFMSSDLPKKTIPDDTKVSGKSTTSTNPIGGWLFISALCIMAFLLNVPFGIIIVAIIGYAISSS